MKYDERLRDDLQKEYGRLSNQRTFAWLLLGISVSVFVSNLLGIGEPTNHMLGVVSLVGVAGSGICPHTVRSELARNLRRSVENSRDLDDQAR